MNELLRKPVALIIDDESSICESLAGVLADEGWQTKKPAAEPRK